MVWKSRTTQPLPSSHGQYSQGAPVPLCTPNGDPGRRTVGEPAWAGCTLLLRLLYAGLGRANGPANQAAARTKGGRGAGALVDGQLLLPGAASSQPWRAGQEPGSQRPEEAPTWGNAAAERVQCPPHRLPALGHHSEGTLPSRLPRVWPPATTSTPQLGKGRATRKGLPKVQSQVWPCGAASEPDPKVTVSLNGWPSAARMGSAKLRAEPACLAPRAWLWLLLGVASSPQPPVCTSPPPGHRAGAAWDRHLLPPLPWHSDVPEKEGGTSGVHHGRG